MNLTLFEQLIGHPGLFSRLSIAVVGDVALDRSFFCKASVPGYHAVHGSETIFDVERDDYGELGSAGNTCHLARSLGVQAHLFSMVGDDPEGVRVREILSRDGTPHTLLELPGTRTVARYRVLFRDERRGAYDLRFRMDKEEADHAPIFARAARQARAGDFLRTFARVVADCDAVYFNDTAKGFLSRELLREMGQALFIARQARPAAGRRAPVVVVDPKNDWDKFRGLPVDVFKPNAREAGNALALPWRDDATGNPEWLLDLARRLLSRFGSAFPLMVVTLGRQGVALLEAGRDGGALHRYPALELFPQPPHAATHCGDMFGSALALGLALGAELPAALSFGLAAASVQYALPVGRKLTRDDLLDPANRQALLQKASPRVLLGRDLGAA